MTNQTWMRTISWVQWLSWVFATQERKKVRWSGILRTTPSDWLMNTESEFPAIWRISTVISTFSVFGLSSGAPATSFGISRSRYRVWTLFRGSKNSVVICRASLSYKFGNQFCSTVFVRTDSHVCFPAMWNPYPEQATAFSKCQRQKRSWPNMD